MNKFFFIICFCFLFSFQMKTIYGQKDHRITISFKDQSINSALFQLKKELIMNDLYYNLIIQDTIINNSRKINKYFKDETINNILDVLIEKSDYCYCYSGTRVIVYKKEGKNLQSNENLGPKQLFIKGKVIDEDGNSVLASICIIPKDSSISNLIQKDCSYTDNEGIYTISINDSNTYVIVTSLSKLPRVVHIRNSELIKMETDLESMDRVLYKSNKP